MEVYCSFKSIVGGTCGFESRDRKCETQILPLLSCTKDIAKHKSVFSFSGPEDEVDLILCRAGSFKRPDRLSDMTVCPLHRAKLGIGWRRSSTRCRVPPALSNHGKNKRNWPKDERGIGKNESEMLLHKTGVFVQVGSGICRKCRDTLTQLITEGGKIPDLDEVDALGDQLDRTTLKDDEEVTFNPSKMATQVVPEPQTPQSILTLDLYDTPSSIYLQTSANVSLLSETGDEVQNATSKEKLNSFLASRDISPIRTSMNTPWEIAAERTKRHYVRKARQAVFATLEEIAPQSSEMLLSAIQISAKEDINIDSTLLEALVECYENATHWSTRRQILSIIADKVSFAVLQKWIPGLSRYRYDIARHHTLLHGRGSLIPQHKNTRMYISPQKLDHFLSFITSASVTQDLPFGEKTLVLSTKTQIKIPNVIRTSIPEQIVRQYQSYCSEIGFSPMSRSSLCRILKVCSAYVRKSLQGLDYVSSEGAKAFDDLTDSVDKIGDSYNNNGLSWSKDINNKLKLAKRYLKGDYKVHVSPSTRVADHCRAYALSHAADKDYTCSCDHDHDLKCDRCCLISDAIEEIESILKNLQMAEEEKQEMEYVVSQCKKNINAWKAHLIRSVNQDDARLDIIDKLDANSVLVVLDWAMKFLPRKYRESQADWFGKRGISWHISVAMRKSESEIQSLTFVHVFKSCTQDSYTVLPIIEDVLKQLKIIMPELNCVNFRQDNAGCYHSSPTILGVQKLGERYEVKARMDFSDPQGGKEPCDRKAATIKSHMRVFLNSGHDIETAAQMKSAIESNGGVPGVRVMLCKPPVNEITSFKWEGISFLNNVEYVKDGIKVWRAYGIGAGKLLPLSDFEMFKMPSESTLDLIEDSTSPKQTFCTIKARRKDKQLQETTSTVTALESSKESVISSVDDVLFSCPEQGCVMTYRKHFLLQNHLDAGKHKYVLERETLLDKAMIKYASNLEHGASDIEHSVGEKKVEGNSLSYKTALLMGWALKSAGAQRRRFTEKQKKKNLTEVFLLGEQTGHKANASEVSTNMRKARNTDGSFVFSSSDYLTPQQITGFFSRMKAKKSVSQDDDEDDDQDDYACIEETNFQELHENVMTDLAITHPITYDTYNLCELVSKAKMAKFSIAMLQDMSSYFELDVSEIQVKRKKPYIDLLTNLVNCCSCQC